MIILTQQTRKGNCQTFIQSTYNWTESETSRNSEKHHVFGEPGEQRFPSKLATKITSQKTTKVYTGKHESGQSKWTQ